MYKIFFKRFIDILVSFVVLVFAMPLLLLASLLLFINNGGSIFFVQERPGLHGKPFHILKFKTMNDRKDEQGNLLPDHIRLTPLGKFIRKTSIDELPQLLNVLKGDISLIGPRPLLMEYLPLYSREQSRRHEVKPGITGWAQVNGRNALTWEQKFEYDIYYVDHLSFALDLKIIFLTVYKIFKSEGVSSGTYITMEKFTGSKQGQ